MTGAFHGRSFFAQNADFSVNLQKCGELYKFYMEG